MDEMKLHKLLMRFADDDNSQGFHRPLEIDGSLYYTNGKIIVTAPLMDVDRDNAHSLADKVKKYGDVANGNCGFNNLPEFPDFSWCARCNGHGAVEFKECEDCDGRGWFEHGNHDYDCKNCEETGRVVVEGGEKFPCSHCRGTGIINVGSTRIDGFPFGLVYLSLIKMLPGARVCVVPPEAGDDVATLLFRYDHGVGALRGRRCD